MDLSDEDSPACTQDVTEEYVEEVVEEEEKAAVAGPTRKDLDQAELQAVRVQTLKRAVSRKKYGCP